MENHLDEEFEGVISGVTEWGFFVELPNTVEGLVRISELRGYYHFYEDTYELVEESGKKSYKLGQRVTVRVANCDRLTRTVDFEVVE